LACEVLVQQYQDAIFSYCSCHLLDWGVAQEVAQDVFLAAFEGMPRFRGQSSVKTWLYRIALKKCLEARRNSARREVLAQDHQHLIADSAHCDPPAPLEEVITREHQKWRVWQTLRRLRVGERELVVLRYLEELTHEEIAQIFRISTKTVERRLARAEAKFCTAYERCQSHAIPQR
jgi:RNA polymerase sigma-70 factor (ECF subfamily)